MNDNIIAIIAISFAIFFSPLLSRFIRVPTVPIEIIVGSILGFIGFIHPDEETFKMIAEIGFLYLMFLIGIELNLKKMFVGQNGLIKQSFLYLGLLYFLSLLVTLYAGLSAIFIVILPMLSIGLLATLKKDYGSDTQWLNLAIIVGVLGEIVSITVLTFTHSVLEFGVTQKLFIAMLELFAFFVLFYLMFKLIHLVTWWFPEVKTYLVPYYDNHEQDIRLSMALFFIMIALMLYLDIELAFGAFLAGLLIATFFDHHEKLPEKLSTFGFGLLVPIFFIYIGATFHLDALFWDGLVEKAIIISFLMIVIRIISATIFINTLGTKNTILFALSHSMPLTLLIAVATLAYHSNSIDEFHYFAFILASLIEVVVVTVGIKIITSYNTSKKLES